MKLTIGSVVITVLLAATQAGAHEFDDGFAEEMIDEACRNGTLSTCPDHREYVSCYHNPADWLERLAVRRGYRLVKVYRENRTSETIAITESEDHWAIWRWNPPFPGTNQHRA